MPLATRDARRDGGSVLSMHVVVVVCIASAVATLTVGVLAWKFFRRRNKNALPTSTPAKCPLSPTTVFHIPLKPELTHLADTEKGLGYANRIHSLKFSPPPVYGFRPMKSSPASFKKFAPALNLDVSCNAEPTQTSPIRSASFNPGTNTQSFGSRISAHLPLGAKKLPRLMTVTVLYVPSLSDELPIRLGETIRMIEEYEDEWCLVQRVGRTDERGVIPRFCLTERQEIIPRLGNKTSCGLLQTSTFRK